MGVADLNKIVKNFRKADRKFDRIYIDASNLIVTFIHRHLNNLPRCNTMRSGPFWAQIVDLNARTRDQTQFFALDRTDQFDDVSNCIIKDTNELIMDYSNMLNPDGRFVLVSDPFRAEPYFYQYNDEIKMTCVSRDMFNHWLQVNDKTFDGSAINFSSKEEEHERRAAAAPKTKVQVFCDLISTEPIFETSNYSDFDEGANLDVDEDTRAILDDPECIKLFEFIREGLYFVNRRTLLRSIPGFQYRLAEYAGRSNNVDYLISKSEADIFIKSRYLSEPKPSLIISNDTDYDMLFGEMPDVCTTPLSAKRVVCPFDYWSNLFETKEPSTLRLILCRMSALLGNDYTVKKRQVVADKDTLEYWPYLFNIKSHQILDAPDLGRRSSIGKLLQSCKSAYRPLDRSRLQTLSYSQRIRALALMNREDMFRHIDKAIMTEAPIEFFNGYFETIMIYTNAQFYDGYRLALDEALGPFIVNKLHEVPYRIVFNSGTIEKHTVEDYQALIEDIEDERAQEMIV